MAMEYGRAMGAEYAQNAASGLKAGIAMYDQVSSGTQERDRGGLARIADSVLEQAARIDQIAIMLQGVAHGIHGPRPEAVGNSSGEIKGAPTDSLSSRVNQLNEAVDRLQRAYESVIR